MQGETYARDPDSCMDPRPERDVNDGERDYQKQDRDGEVQGAENGDRGCQENGKHRPFDTVAGADHARAQGPKGGDDRHESQPCDGDGEAISCLHRVDGTQNCRGEQATERDCLEDHQRALDTHVERTHTVKPSFADC